MANNFIFNGQQFALNDLERFALPKGRRVELNREQQETLLQVGTPEGRRRTVLEQLKRKGLLQTDSQTTWEGDLVREQLLKTGKQSEQVSGSPAPAQIQTEIQRRAVAADQKLPPAVGHSAAPNGGGPRHEPSGSRGPRQKQTSRPKRSKAIRSGAARSVPNDPQSPSESLSYERKKKARSARND